MILQSVLQRLPRIRRRANSHPKHGTTARDQTSIRKRIKTTGDVLIPSRVMTLWPALLRGCCCGCGVETGLERWGLARRLADHNINIGKPSDTILPSAIRRTRIFTVIPPPSVADEQHPAAPPPASDDVTRTSRRATLPTRPFVPSRIRCKR
jgi:hypothetical protein